MERYKLIKLYPGSPDLGTIVYSPHIYKAYKDMEGYFKTKNPDRYTSIMIFYSEDYIKKEGKGFWKKIK